MSRFVTRFIISKLVVPIEMVQHDCIENFFIKITTFQTNITSYHPTTILLPTNYQTLKTNQQHPNFSNVYCLLIDFLLFSDSGRTAATLGTTAHHVPVLLVHSDCLGERFGGHAERHRRRPVPGGVLSDQVSNQETVGQVHHRVHLVFLCARRSARTDRTASGLHTGPDERDDQPGTV